MSVVLGSKTTFERRSSDSDCWSTSAITPSWNTSVSCSNSFFVYFVVSNGKVNHETHERRAPDRKPLGQLPRCPACAARTIATPRGLT